MSLRRRASPYLLTLTTIGALFAAPEAMAEPPKPAPLPIDAVSNRAQGLASEASYEEPITTLKAIVAHAQGAQRAEMMFRLAELYWGKAGYARARGMLAHDTAYVDWVSAGQHGEPPALNDHLRESETLRRTARSILEKLLAEAPDYARGDEVHFNLGLYALESNDGAGARKQLSRLIELFPHSRLLASAHLQLGELDFAADRLEPARRHYQAALTAPGIQGAHAQYKLAWCDFNEEAYAAGIQKLVALARAGAKAPLAAEARRDLVLFYARSGEIPAAIAFFDGDSDRLRALASLEALAAQLRAQGDTVHALEVSLVSANNFRTHPRALLLEIQLEADLISLQRSPEVGARVARLGSDFGPNSTWRRALPAGVISGTLDEATVLLRTFATDQHRAPEASAHALALSLYDAWLELFDGAPDSAELRLYRAELLTERGRLAEAAGEWDRIAADAGAGPHRLTAAERAVEVRQQLARNAAPESRAAAEQSLVEAADRYLTLAPDAEDAAAVAFVAASAREPVDPADALRRYTRILAQPTLAADPALSKQVQDRWAAATYERIQLDETRVRASIEGMELGLIELADRFAGLQARLPTGEYADEALLSAARLYSEAGRIDAALESSSLFAERYGASEHAASNRLLYAELHERIGDFEHAALINAEMARRFPNHPEAPNALLAAATLFEAKGKPEIANEMLAKWLDRYPDHAEASEVYLRRCALLLDRRRFAAAEKCAAGYNAQFAHAKVSELIRAEDQKARAWSALDRDRLARQARERIVDLAHSRSAEPLSPEARAAAAAAAFTLIEPALAEFRRLHVTLDARTLRKKLASAQALTCEPSSCAQSGRYFEVIRLGDPSLAVAALTRIGDVHQELANALADSPRPPGLSDEQWAIYQAQLEGWILPLREKSVQAYDLAIHKAQELGLYDPYVIHARATLEAINDRQLPTLAPPVRTVDVLIEAPIRSANRR